MGAKGPVPKATSVTRHPPKQNPRKLTGAAVKPPELAGDHRAETIAWWNAWLEHPAAPLFLATDWQALLRGAALMDAFTEKPSAQLAAEIRQIEARVGGMLADRDRLGMKVEAPAAPEAEGPAPRRNRDRPDPRQ